MDVLVGIMRNNTAKDKVPIIYAVPHMYMMSYHHSTRQVRTFWFLMFSYQNSSLKLQKPWLEIWKTEHSSYFLWYPAIILFILTHILTNVSFLALSFQMCTKKSKNDSRGILSSGELLRWSLLTRLKSLLYINSNQFNIFSYVWSWYIEYAHIYGTNIPTIWLYLL